MKQMVSEKPQNEILIIQNSYSNDFLSMDEKR